MRPSKLIAPQIGGLVARQRLFREVEQAPPKGIVWIAAPPGAGKPLSPRPGSIRVEAPHGTGHALWYRIDETDCRSGDLLRNAGTGGCRIARWGAPYIAEADPGCAAEPQSLRPQLVQVPPRQQGAGALSVRVRRHARLPPDSAVVEILAILAGALLAQDRLLCLSRESPPAPLLLAAPEETTSPSSAICGSRRGMGRFCARCPWRSRKRPRDIRCHGTAVRPLDLDLVVRPSSASLARRSAHSSALAARAAVCRLWRGRPQAPAETAFLQAGQEEEWRMLEASAISVLHARQHVGALVISTARWGPAQARSALRRLRAAAEAELGPDALVARAAENRTAAGCTRRNAHRCPPADAGRRRR